MFTHIGKKPQVADHERSTTRRCWSRATQASSKDEALEVEFVMTPGTAQVTTTHREMTRFHNP